MRLSDETLFSFIALRNEIKAKPFYEVISQ